MLVSHFQRICGVPRCADVLAETVRKVRIAAIITGKVLLEAIFGAVLRAWGALSEYGAKWGANLPGVRRGSR